MPSRRKTPSALVDPEQDSPPRRQPVRRPALYRAVLPKRLASILLIVATDPAGKQSDPVEQTLMEAGHEVTRVGDVEDAVRRCDQCAFDLLISDSNLPDDATWRLTDDLRRCCNGRGIILSHGGLTPIARQALERGYGVYVADPFDRESLLQVVQDLLASTLH